jgi:hypothetical protein
MMAGVQSRPLAILCLFAAGGAARWYKQNGLALGCCTPGPHSSPGSQGACAACSPPRCSRSSGSVATARHHQQQGQCCMHSRQAQVFKSQRCVALSSWAEAELQVHPIYPPVLASHSCCLGWKSLKAIAIGHHEALDSTCETWVGHTCGSSRMTSAPSHSHRETWPTAGPAGLGWPVCGHTP